MKRVAEEQARSIEDMKSKEQVTSRKFEEMSQKFEELRSLVANPSENGAKTRSIFGRTLEVMSGSHDESFSMDCDTFSLMTISPVCSLSWNLGFVSAILMKHYSG